MGGFNWVDIVIIILLLTGMAIGFTQGLIRQLIGLVALYIGLVLATQFFRPLSQAGADVMNTAPNTLSNAAAFFVILIAAMSVINYFALDAYKSTKIRLIPFLDQITGIFLGVLSMWIVLSVAVNVLAFAANTQVWPGNSETFRLVLRNGLEQSRLVEVTSTTLPMIVSTIRPWLPGGLPALFDL
jgi:membrane protein required for colicin V production